MLISTADTIPGKSYEVLGLVRGNIVTSKNIGRDLMASVKSVVGGASAPAPSRPAPSRCSPTGPP